ncbi:MAG TPA: serine/threonine-protein kinase [Kofleriaceae bacterium]|nr:serine/threonine-protein kinase [Kofleriaceae bacterium]
MARSDQEADGFVPLPLAVELEAGSAVGEYVIAQKLGEGGMATVYGAIHPVIGKKAAVKVMTPAMSADAQQVERFVQEARAVNAIGHPNIVDVFAFGTLPDGRCYFMMEWLQGETLHNRLWQHRLALDETLDIVDQMCDALEAAHEKGIIHRDLKPANVFLVPTRGRRDGVKLLDFGVAKLMTGFDVGNAVSGPHTQRGLVVGTPDYISPEQARGRDVDGRTDIYALGVMTYEMVLGRLPFQADNMMDTLRMHLSELPPVPRTIWPEIPSILESLLLGMLAKDADARPSLAEIRQGLKELRGTPVPIDFADTSKVSVSAAARQSQSTVFEAVPRRINGRFVGAALLVFAVGTLGGLGYQALRRHAMADSPTHAPVRSPAIAPPAPAPARVPSPAVPATTLVVDVNVADARIVLDGRVMAERAASARLADAPAGRHRLQVTAPGHRPYDAEVTVEDGVTTRLPIVLEREARRRPTARPSHKDPDYLVNPLDEKAR